jgi:hypothetical protein
MSSSYEHLARAQVRPGMVLSDVLLDQHGQVLLPQGAILTAAIIALLPRHGIEMLAVLRSDAPAEPAPDHAALEKRLAHLFRKKGTGAGENIVNSDNPDNWATSLLHRYMEDYRLGREIEQ